MLKAQKRLSQGLTFLTAYTFSKNFDRSSGGTGSDVNRGSQGPQNAYNLPAEWAPSIVDATHRLSFTASYELPFGRNKRFLGNANRFLNAVLGGYQLAFVGQVVSQSFQVASSNWGATSPVELYKSNTPITDCRPEASRMGERWPFSRLKKRTS